MNGTAARSRSALALAAALTLLGAARVAPAAVPDASPAVAASPLAARLDAALEANRATLVEWRRHLHAHPELGNREVETAKFVAETLRSFGLEPRTGVAK